VSELIPLLDPNGRPGRTRFRLSVTAAKDYRAQIRRILGTSRDDTPTTYEIIRAARHLSSLLHDSTEGEASLLVRIQCGDDVETHHPAVIISTLNQS
jgi:hypothetical protein